MTARFRWRKGKPDKPGWWWLWPDKKFHGQAGGPAGPRIVEVRRQADVTPGKPELYMQGVPDRNSRLEAFLFKGRIAGPIPAPTH
jgi:hypothetical protein